MSRKLQTVVTIAIFACIVALPVFSSQAFAGPGSWGFDPDHWERFNDPPYMENPTETQNTQWDNDPWTPSVWAQQRQGGAKKVLQDFHDADIIRDFYVKSGTAAVNVGPGFYMLGGNDQRRVAAMIDSVYGVTKNKVFGMFTLYDWNNHLPIGTYTQYGLQMK